MNPSNWPNQVRAGAWGELGLGFFKKMGLKPGPKPKKISGWAGIGVWLGPTQPFLLLLPLPWCDLAKDPTHCHFLVEHGPHVFHCNRHVPSLLPGCQSPHLCPPDLKASSLPSPFPSLPSSACFGMLLHGTV